MSSPRSALSTRHIFVDTCVKLPHVGVMNSISKLLATALCSALPCLASINSFAQANQSYSLPAPGYDIALASDGTAVVSLRGTNVVWVRDAAGIPRTPSFDSGLFKVQLKSNGSKAYLLGIDTPNLYVFTLGPDSAVVRSFDALPIDFKLSPDEGRVVVGLNNKTSIISDTIHFEDGIPLSLSHQPRAIAIAPDSSTAYLGVGGSIVRIDIQSRRILQSTRIRGAVKNLALSPSGKRLYVITAQPPKDGKTSYLLRVMNTETNKVTAVRKIEVAGSATSTFDIEAGARNIFISSTQPLVTGTRNAGVVRVATQKNGVGRPQFFAQANAGAGPIGYSGSSRSLGIILTSSQLVQFRRTPR